MVEDADTVVSHDHAIFIASICDALVTSASSRLSNILNSVFRRDIDVVTEWEESIGGKGYTGKAFKEFFLFSLR